jgi:hypothetical protein
MEYVYIVQDGEICSGVFNLGEVEYVTRDFEDALCYLADLILDSEDDDYPKTADGVKNFICENCCHSNTYGEVFWTTFHGTIIKCVLH